MKKPDHNFHWLLSWTLIVGSSCSQMFFKIGFLKNFAIFRGKHLYWNLFLIKLQALRPVFLLKRDEHRCFPVNIAKFLKTAFYRTPPVTASLLCIITCSSLVTMISKNEQEFLIFFLLTQFRITSLLYC